MLKQIKKPPKKLYYKGNIDLLKQNNIAIIGTRHSTDYGDRNARKFSKQISNLGVNIVSGMAVGIDTAAHKACIEAGNKTIAVLPCGLSNIFPKENLNLFHQIIDSGGLVLSEYSAETAASSSKFIARNRIVAGLSMCTVVIEGAYRSGTSVTAKLAFDQGKSVFCVPGNLENKYSVATNTLIKKGANLLTCIEDIIEKYPFLEQSQKKNNTPFIPEECRELYNHITEISISDDELLQETGLSISDLNFQLTLLEIGHFIIQLPGGNYIRNES